MGHALDVVAVIVDIVNISLISQFGGLRKKRQYCENKMLPQCEGGITQHAIEKIADSKVFTFSKVS